MAATLAEFLDELDEFLDNRADADYQDSTGRPTCNDEMRLLVMLRDNRAAWNAAREASGTVIAEGTLLHAYGNTIHFNEDDAVNMREVVAATGQRVHVAIVGGEGG